MVKVLAICRDGTNRSVKLCEILNKKGIDCVATGHSDLAKQFKRHYSQVEDDFDLAVLLDDDITIKQARKIINDIENTVFNGCLLPEVLFAPLDEEDKDYEKHLEEVANKIERTLKQTKIVLSDKYFKKLQEDEEERRQFKEALKKAEEMDWL